MPVSVTPSLRDMGQITPRHFAVCGGFRSQELQRWLEGEGCILLIALIQGENTLEYSFPIALLEETISSLVVGAGGRSQVRVAAGPAEEGLSPLVRMWEFYLPVELRAWLQLKFKCTLKSLTQPPSWMGHKRGGIRTAS